MKNIVIFGGGRIGEMRAEICRKNKIFNVVGIIDPVKEIREKLISKGFTKVFEGIDEVNEKVDGAWISTPTRFHKPVIVMAAEKGWHIYCEKPLTDSIDTTKEMIEFCKKKKVALHCAWQKRFDEDFAKLKEKFTSKDWKHIRIVDRDNPTPTDEILSGIGSIVQDMSGHSLNLVLYMTDSEYPVEVFCHGVRAFNTSVTDAIEMILKYDNGDTQRTVNCEITRHSPDGYDQRVEVHTMKEKLLAIREIGDNGFSFPDRFADAFKNEMLYFKNVLEAKDPLDVSPRTPVKDNCAVIKLIEALEESYYRKRSVSLDKDLNVIDSNLMRIPMRFIGKGGFGSFINDLIVSDEKRGLEILPAVRKSNELTIEKDIVNDGSVKAVYVVSPDHLHDVHAIKCLKAGKHVFVEKPVYNFDKVGLQAMSSMLILMVGFQRRFDDQFIAARKYLEGNAPEKVVIESFDPVPAELNTMSLKERNFVIGNSIIHDIDLLCWFFPNGLYEIVSVVPGNDTGIEITAVVTHKDGKKTSVIMKFHKNDKLYVQRVRVGEKSFGYGYDPKSGKSGLPFELYNDAYQRQYNYFNGLVRGNIYDPKLIQTYMRTFHLYEQILKVSDKVGDVKN